MDLPAVTNLLLLVSIVAASPATHAQRARSAPTNLSASQIARNILPSVVAVASEDARGHIVFGSGFFIAENTIATNYHVIRGARTIVAKLVIQKKWLAVRDVVGFDEETLPFLGSKMCA